MNQDWKALLVCGFSCAVVFLMAPVGGGVHAGGHGDKWEGVPTITLQVPGKKDTLKCQKPGEATQAERHHHEGIDNITLGFGDLEKYHGHVCPGIALGYRATQVALAHLYPGEIPPRGDQFVVSGILRACPADGISYVTGARYGKGSEGAFNGNLAFDKTIGDSSFVFASMTTGKAVKLTNVFEYPKEMEELKTKKDTDLEANARYEAISRCVAIRMLTAPEKEVFEVKPLSDFSWKEHKQKYLK